MAWLTASLDGVCAGAAEIRQSQPKIAAGNAQQMRLPRNLSRAEALFLPVRAMFQT